MGEGDGHIETDLPTVTTDGKDGVGRGRGLREGVVDYGKIPVGR